MAQAQFTPYDSGLAAIQSRGFSDELGRVPLVSGQPVRLAQVCEVLTSAELPRNLDVGGSIELVVFDVGAVRQRPSTTRFEVCVPRQGCAELLRTRPEQIEFVTHDGIGGLRHRRRGVRVLGQESLDDVRLFGTSR